MEKTIRFTSQQTVRIGEGHEDEHYEVGQEYTLREDRADRWLRRGVAVEVKLSERGAWKPSVNSTGDIPSFAYDAAAADVASGKQTIEQAAQRIHSDYKGDVEVVRIEIEKRVTALGDEERKKRELEQQQRLGESNKRTEAPRAGVAQAPAGTTTEGAGGKRNR